MSADLWREFAHTDFELLESLWAHEPKPEAQGGNNAVDDDTDDDEFGDFEGPNPQNQIHEVKFRLNEIEGLAQPLFDAHADSIVSIPQLQVSPCIPPQDHRPFEASRATGKSNKITDLKSSSSVPLSVRSKTVLSKQIAGSEHDEDDEWENFFGNLDPKLAYESSQKGDGFLKSNAIHGDQVRKSSGSPLTSHIVDVTTASSSHQNLMVGGLTVSKRSVEQGPPPSNVPPPLILLLLITTLFQSIYSDIRRMIPSGDASVLNRNQSDPTSVDKVTTQLAIIRAAARIIAGRKLRWRRDSRLSQNVKIGPANAGKVGGMKLTVVDKTQNQQEDREVEEAIWAWKQQSGSLRAVLSNAYIRQLGINIVLPDIVGEMPVRQSKPSEGAITASRCCFLCGLKRDERVEKIDAKVEDSFGEWWVDHWGHADCVSFWTEKRESLQQR